MEDTAFFAMECLDCGWDWIGDFAVCIHCGGGNTRLVEESSDKKMFERIYWINIKKIEGFYDPYISIDEIDRMFGQGWEVR